jgi:hypothetical protein
LGGQAAAHREPKKCLRESQFEVDDGQRQTAARHMASVVRHLRNLKHCKSLVVGSPKSPTCHAESRGLWDEASRFPIEKMDSSPDESGSE